jgi:hypothetical protein
MRKALILAGFLAAAALSWHFQIRAEKAPKNSLAPQGGIAGRVEDHYGKPVGGARVSVAAVSPAVNLFPPLRLARADSQGNFRVGHLPPGRYRLMAMPASVPTSPRASPESSRGRPGPFLRTAVPTSPSRAFVLLLEIGPGQELSGIQLLIPAASPGSHWRSIRASNRPPAPPLG